VISLQALAGLTGFLAALFWFGPVIAWSLVFGAGLSVVTGYWLMRHTLHAAELEPEHGRRAMHAHAAMRLLFVLAALFLAYGLGLYLPAVAAGLFLAQASVYMYAVVHAGKGMRKTGS